MNDPLSFQKQHKEMIGHTCLVCEKSTYQVLSTQDIFNETVTCECCDDTIPLFMTKSEILRHIANSELQEELLDEYID